MANYSINPTAAQEIAGDMAGATSTLASSLDTLQTAVQRFTAANHGQAPDSYADAQRLWNQGQIEMSQALTTGHQKLQEIAANYVNGDNRGAAVFGG